MKIPFNNFENINSEVGPFLFIHFKSRLWNKDNITNTLNHHSNVHMQCHANLVMHGYALYSFAIKAIF